MRLPVLALCLLPATTSAQTDQGTSALWEAVFRAFTCSFYAGMLDDAAERERLFTLRYKAARQVFADVEAGRVEEPDRESIGATVDLLLQGSPSHDFAIGRIHERITNAALEHVHTENSLDFSKATENARAAYQTESCDLVR